MRKPRKKVDNNLLFIFKDAKIFVSCNPEIYGKEKEAEIRNVANHLSHEVYIDRTYVDYEGTKYEKTIITEEGWNGLCSLLHVTDFGRKVDDEERQTIQEAYKNIILQYVFQCLEDLGYDISNIHLEILANTSFTASIHRNLTTDNYPGKWQTWPCNQ